MAQVLLQMQLVIDSIGRVTVVVLSCIDLPVVDPLTLSVFRLIRVMGWALLLGLVPNSVHSIKSVFIGLGFMSFVSKDLKCLLRDLRKFRIPV